MLHRSECKNGKKDWCRHPILAISCFVVGLVCCTQQQALISSFSYKPAIGLWSQHRERLTNNGPVAKTNNTSNTTRTTTSFDQLVQTSYAMFSTPVVSTEKRRQAFELSEWKHKTSGGLLTDDRILLAKIYGQAESVFEFGLGESTVLANHMGVPRYVGLDSDPNYIAQVREKVSPHFRFLWADIGPTRAWGYPDDQLLSKNVYNYQIAPLLTEHKAFDVYMVDGRWRLPCMLASFLHASAKKMEAKGLANGQLPLNETYDTHTTVIMHDCFQEGHSPANKAKNPTWNREIYRAADHLLDLVNHSGQRMCIYKRKSTTSDQDLLHLWMSNYNQVE